MTNRRVLTNGAFLATSLMLTSYTAAQTVGTPDGNPQGSAHYTVTDLGTLGGTFSYALGINDEGAICGYSSLPGEIEHHPFLWRHGAMVDVGTFGGENALGGCRPNSQGEVVGSAESTTPDPNGEDVCGLLYGPSDMTCVPFVWRDGVKTALPTLGGNNGSPQSINNRGQIPGFAENTTPDASCPAGRTNYRESPPVIWEDGAVEQLPTVSGDPDGYAIGINDRGQIAGASGVCLTSDLTNAGFLHALVWQRRGGAGPWTVTDLGNLGGANNNYAIKMTNQGQVAGTSGLTGNVYFHAFVWRKGVMTDLGTLPGDVNSFGFGINEQGELVGESDDAAGNASAALWKNGLPIDLNTVIPAGSPLYLLTAFDNNSRGEIVGLALELSSGEVHAFLAAPQGDAVSPPEQASSRIVLPENIRALLGQRLRFGRGGVPLPGLPSPTQP